VDGFLERLDEISKESDLIKVKDLVALAKKEYGAKIKALISGQDEKSLEEIKDIQEKIISLSEQKQKLGSELAEENFRLNNLQEKIISLSEKINEKEKDLIDIKTKLDKAAIQFNFLEAESEKRNLEKELKIIEEKINELSENNQEEKLRNEKYQAEQELQVLIIKRSFSTVNS
jgi:chromosome segregation ATPase